MGGRGSSSGIKKGGGFRILGTREESDAFFGVKSGGSYDEWERDVTFEERYATQVYTGTSYRRINRYLRTGEFGPYDEQEIKTLVNDIDASIAKFDLKRGITVFRGAGSELIGGAKSVEEINAMKGTVVRDKGFFSTTTTREKSFNGMKYEVKVPKGRGRGAWVAPISGIPSENEFLLKRNTNFRIAGGKMDSKGNTVCILEVID